MRSKHLDVKNNNNYNVITGEDRAKVQVPHHDRYNPILGQVGNQVVGSRRSMASAHSVAASGIVPGLHWDILSFLIYIYHTLGLYKYNC